MVNEQCLNGIMECWNDEILRVWKRLQDVQISVFHYSIIPLFLYISILLNLMYKLKKFLLI